MPGREKHTKSSKRSGHFLSVNAQKAQESEKEHGEDHPKRGILMNFAEMANFPHVKLPIG